MEVLVVFLILVHVMQVTAQCSTVCYCSMDSATCYISSCDDELPTDALYKIDIYGKLCENQKLMLESHSYQTSIVTLHSDFCPLGLENCMWVYYNFCITVWLLEDPDAANLWACLSACWVRASSPMCWMFMSLQHSLHLDVKSSFFQTPETDELFVTVSLSKPLSFE
jgi:hypothetical protein